NSSGNPRVCSRLGALNGLIFETSALLRTPFVAIGAAGRHDPLAPRTEGSRSSVACFEARSPGAAAVGRTARSFGCWEAGSGRLAVGGRRRTTWQRSRGPRKIGTPSILSAQPYVLRA